MCEPDGFVVGLAVLQKADKEVFRVRDIPTLLELEEIPILWQYLYMDEDNYITVDNGLAKLEIRMRENCTFHAKNLNFPDLPDLDYTDMMTVSNI